MATKSHNGTGPVPVPVGKTVTYSIQVPPELHARLRKPVTGQGGWQTLMRDVQAHTDPDSPTAEIPDALLRRLIPHAVEFGSGGYQGVIRWVLCLVLAQHLPTIFGQGVSLASLAKAASLKPSKAAPAAEGVTA